MFKYFVLYVVLLIISFNVLIDELKKNNEKFNYNIKEKEMQDLWESGLHIL